MLVSEVDWFCWSCFNLLCHLAVHLLQRMPPRLRKPDEKPSGNKWQCPSERDSFATTATSPQRCNIAARNFLQVKRNRWLGQIEALPFSPGRCTQNIRSWKWLRVATKPDYKRTIYKIFPQTEALFRHQVPVVGHFVLSLFFV